MIIKLKVFNQAQDGKQTVCNKCEIKFATHEASQKQSLKGYKSSWIIKRHIRFH